MEPAQIANIFKTKEAFLPLQSSMVDMPGFEPGIAEVYLSILETSLE